MKIEVTEEQYKAFQNGESITLVPPKKEYVIEYDRPWYINSIHQPSQSSTEIYKSAALYTLGELRTTKENIIYKQKRNQRANRLEALVEDLQGELGVGDYYIFYRIEEKVYRRCARHENNTFPDVVMMKKETAEKVCELLNSGQYSLEG